jgi:hypothetical protein
MHHFATKARLLQEADDVVASRFIEAMTPPVDNLSPAETINAIAGQLSNLIGGEPDLRGYVRCSFLEGTTSGAAIFDQLVEVTVKQIYSHLPEHTMTDYDLRWTATQVVAINLAGLIFEPFLEKENEQSPFSNEAIARRTMANARFIQAGLANVAEHKTGS